ncbi:MAG TPA: RIP metalloprotease RseP [Spirochaetes bacterium]|nr:RIP metalloprotease RseP [Spirochaetota bacterium]
MAALTYIVAAVVLLGLCIFVHELGHLLGGRMVGIKAKVFSIGYGKGILKKKIGDTTYQLTLIPFGGYCQFYGEDPSEDREGKEYEFLTAHPFRRIVTVIMGPLFNLLFGILLFFTMNLVGYSVETNRIHIPDYFTTGEYISPAYAAGMRSGDRVVDINGSRVTGFSDIQSAIVFSSGKARTIGVLRDGERKDFVVTPKKYTEKGYFTIGVVPYGERVMVVRTLEKDVAREAGIEEMDEIKTIDGKEIKTPEEFTSHIRANANRQITMRVVRAGREKTVEVTPRFREVLKIENFVNKRFPGEKAEVRMDRIDLVRKAIEKGNLSVNGRKIATFDEFKSVLERNRGREIALKTAGGVYTGKAVYQKYGFIGVETAVAPEMVEVQYGVGDGFLKSLVDPYRFVMLNLKGMGMLFTGKLDVRENLSGPIRIAKIAGDTAYYRGISAFIILMAKISIILMVMNLLPIPAVDGSYILFFLYEAIKGKPINEKIMERIQFFGIMLLIVLGIFVVFNDLSTLPFFQKFFN